MDPNSAFKRAVLEGALEAVRRALDAGADPETPIDAKRSQRQPNRDLSAAGFRALHVAAYEDDAALAALLLERGADPWAKTQFDRVALVLAAEWSSPGFVRVFLAAGIDPDATDARPVVAARRPGDRAIAGVTVWTWNTKRMVRSALVAMMLAGCAATTARPDGAGGAALRFPEDVFAFANETVWEYHHDPATGRRWWYERDPRPPFSLRCGPMARAIRQYL